MLDGLQKTIRVEDVARPRPLREDIAVDGVGLPNLTLAVVSDVRASVERCERLRSDCRRQLVLPGAAYDVLCTPATAAVVADDAQVRELRDESGLDSIVATKVRSLCWVLPVIVSDNLLYRCRLIALDERASRRPSATAEASTEPIAPVVCAPLTIASPRTSM